METLRDPGLRCKDLLVIFGGPGKNDVAKLRQDAKWILENTIKPLFAPESADGTPLWMEEGAIGVLESIAGMQNLDSLHNLLVPPIMTLVKYHVPSYKTKGVRIAHNLIQNSSPLSLRISGLGEMLIAELTHCTSYLEEHEILEVSLKGLIDLTKVHVKDTVEYFLMLQNMLRNLISKYTFAMTGNVPALVILSNYVLQITRKLSIYNYKYVRIVAALCADLMGYSNSELTRVCIDIITLLADECEIRFHFFKQSVATQLPIILCAIASSWTNDQREDLKSLVQHLKKLKNKQFNVDLEVLMTLNPDLYRPLVSC